MKKKQKQEYFAFETNTSSEEWADKLALSFEDYVRENNHDMRLHVMEDGNRFRIGLERAGHSSGYWYCAHVQQEDGKTRISGRIVFGPNENDEPQEPEKMPFYHWLWAVPLCLIVIILGAIPYALWQFVRWVRRAPKPMEKEELLVQFMTNAMNCSYLNEEKSDVR